MPTIFAANESKVLADGEPVEGVSSIEYSRNQVRTNVYAVGTAERIGLISGPKAVQGMLRVASTIAKLDGLADDATFQLSAQFKHGDAQMTVTFDECYMEEKSLDLAVGGHAQALYRFTATRVREEMG